MYFFLFRRSFCLGSLSLLFFLLFSLRFLSSCFARRLFLFLSESRKTPPRLAARLFVFFLFEPSLHQSYLNDEGGKKNKKKATRLLFFTLLPCSSSSAASFSSCSFSLLLLSRFFSSLSFLYFLFRRLSSFVDYRRFSLLNPSSTSQVPLKFFNTSAHRLSFSSFVLLFLPFFSS